MPKFRVVLTSHMRSTQRGEIEIEADSYDQAIERAINSDDVEWQNEILEDSFRSITEIHPVNTLEADEEKLISLGFELVQRFEEWIDYERNTDFGYERVTLSTARLSPQHCYASTSEGLCSGWCTLDEALAFLKKPGA